MTRLDAGLCALPFVLAFALVWVRERAAQRAHEAYMAQRESASDALWLLAKLEAKGVLRIARPGETK